MIVPDPPDTDVVTKFSYALNAVRLAIWLKLSATGVSCTWTVRSWYPSTPVTVTSSVPVADTVPPVYVLPFTVTVPPVFAVPLMSVTFTVSGNA